MMGWFDILLLGIGLSLDTFAVSLTLGFLGECTTHRQRVRFLIVIGVFHLAMILVGWFVGENVSRIISHYDHWIAFGLLALLGGRMIREGCSANVETLRCSDLLSLKNTLALGVALSIDALITGFSLGLIKIDLFTGSALGNVFLAGVVIGLSAFLISGIAMKIGKHVSSRFGAKAEIFGGVILLGIGLKILLEHLC